MSQAYESQQRSKVSKACTFCKSRKRRCDGQQPCGFCQAKGNEHNCNYDVMDKRSIRYSHWKKTSTPASNLANSIGSRLQRSQTSLRASEPPHGNGLFRASTTTEPSSEHDQEALIQAQSSLSPEESGDTRMLMDNNGNMRFIGESSPLSLLAQTRKIFQGVGGWGLPESKFVNDPKRFNIVDAPDNSISVPAPVLLPLRKQCDQLVQLYLSNSNRLIYIFEERYLRLNIIDEIYSNPSAAPPKKLCQLYLILAIGSIYNNTITRDNSQDHLRFFKSGMNILNNTVQDGNLWLVEVYMLIAFFYQASCKRNTSWLNIGTAIRLAESLGLNRRKINESYSDKAYALHRRKLWRSLYILDRLSSMVLGRPLTINIITWDDDRNSIPISTSQGQNVLDVCESQLVKLCDLNGEIYEKIYYTDRIDYQTAYDLAVRLKRWCAKLPAQLQAENLIKPSALEAIDKEKLGSGRYAPHPLLLLHLTHFNGVILLSRPFFHYYITKTIEQALQKLKGQTPQSTNDTTTIKPFATACVNSAVSTIKFSWFYVKNNIHPLKPYNMITNVFNSGLIVALISLLDILESSEDKKTHIDSLRYGIMILREFAKVDSFAKRFTEILEDVQTALIGVMDGLKGTPGEHTDNGSSNGESDMIDKLNDLDDWLFGSIFGETTRQEENGEQDFVAPAMEMDLLNAFMYNLNANEGVEILFDNTF